MTQPVEVAPAGPVSEETTPPSPFTQRQAPVVEEFRWSDQPDEGPDPLAEFFREAKAIQADPATVEQAKEKAPADATALAVTPPSPEKPAASAPPAQPESPVVPEPREPVDDARGASQTVDINDLLTGELTEARLAEIRRVAPDLAGKLDRAIANRTGNLVQAEREAEAKWQNAFRAYEEMETLEESAPDKYVELLKNSEVALWRDRVEKEAQRRAAPNGQATEVDREALLSELNEGAAYEAQSLIQSLPFYAELSPDFRRKIDGAQQANTNVSWLQEWLTDLTSEIDRRNAKRLKDEVDAARQDERAARGGANPPRVEAIEPSQRLTPDEVILRHAVYGMGTEAGGVTQEQLNWAKQQKGWDQ